MILTENIKIIIGKNNKRIYKKYFTNIEIGQEIDIPINYLPKGSNMKIDVVCDICVENKKIPYCAYNRNIKEYNIYTCPKCSYIKKKQTNLKKYGVENNTQLDYYKNLNSNIQINKSKEEKDDIKNRRKNTCLKKFGVEHISQLDSIKEHKKQTYSEHYGVKNSKQSKRTSRKKGKY